MTQIEEEYIRKAFETEKIQLTFWQSATHYGIVIFFAGLPVISLVLNLWWFVRDIEPPHPEVNNLALFSALIGIVLYFIQKRRLRFKSIQTDLNQDQLARLLDEIILKNKWILMFGNEQILIIKTNPSFWSGSWGEQITILIDTGRLLVNSICDPDSHSSITSFGNNGQNIRLLTGGVKSASR